MNALATRLIALGISLMLAVAPVFAQDAPDASATDQSQPTQGQDHDQRAQSSDDTSAPTPVPTPATTDVAAVIAQWGAAPNIGPDADKALAQRWFREQNSKRARWGVPTATRDPYLDWMAENLLRDHLGQPKLPQPQGLAPPAVVQRSQSDQGILFETEFWTVSDDLWQAWLDTFEAQPPDGWSDARPGEPWFSRDNYLLLFKIQKTPRFDRFRLLGSAGRVDTTNTPPTDIGSGPEGALEQIAPGSVATYRPLDYPDSVVAVVGSDPWINRDGSLRP